MTGRQRLLSLLHHGPTVDRLAWTTLVDDKTRSVMPAGVRELPVLDFYRHIDCDVFQFGNYGLPPELVVPAPSRLVMPDVTVESETDDDGTLTRRTLTPWGELTATFRSGHPVKYPVESLRELRTLRETWLHSRQEETDGMEDAYARVDEAIGDRGIYCPTLAPSPVQRLIEYDMGAANFYYLLNDHPAEVEDLLAAMHARRVEEYEILAARTPADAVMPVENTSSTLVSPKVYRRYSLPQIRDYVRIAHAHGKKVILHMCGSLAGLLGAVAETGLDGWNAQTPPPTGDVTVQEALDAFGEDFTIMGGLLDGSVFQAPTVTREGLWRALDSLYTPRVRRANLLLWLVADGLPTPIERFLDVRDWMERHG